MVKTNRTSCMIVALLLWGVAPALAQTTPPTQQHMPLEKAIGQGRHTLPLRSALLRSVAPRWVPQQQALTPTMAAPAAITPIRPATEG